MPSVAAIFADVVAAGLRRESVRGATDDEITAMAGAQGVRRVPAAVREVLRTIGADHGLWLAGSSVGTVLRGPAAAHARATLAGGPLRDVAGALVLVEHQAYAYHVIDGADLDQDDPPVWVAVEGEPVVRAWPTVTAWFAATAPDVARYRERLALAREIGREPRWARHFRTL